MEGGCDSDDVQMRRCHRIKEMNMIAKLRQATMPIGVGLAGIRDVRVVAGDQAAAGPQY